MTGPGSAACLQDGWGRENPTQTAPGEALTTRHRTGVQFPPSPPTQRNGRKLLLSAVSSLTPLEVGHLVRVLIDDVLGFFLGPFFLDGLDRLLALVPVRRLIRHCALPQQKRARDEPVRFRLRPGYGHVHDADKPGSDALVLA